MICQHTLPKYIRVRILLIFDKPAKMNKIVTEQNKRAGTGFLPNPAKEQGIFGGIVRKFGILFFLFLC